MRKILFIDRDGTLIAEPADYQVDDLSKLRLMPGVIPALLKLKAIGFRFVMVTNQDGLGTASFPTADFEAPHEAMLDCFASQGVTFDAVKICPHLPEDGCACRKPGLVLVQEFLDGRLDRVRSAVIGDRQSDLDLAANMSLPSFRIGADGQTWAEIADALCCQPRRGSATRRTRETDIDVALRLESVGTVRADTGIGFFDHMIEQLGRHSGIDIDVAVRGDLHIDEHHTVEDTALALGSALRQAIGDRVGIQRYGFLLPMDESRAQVALDLSGRPDVVFDGRFTRHVVGGLPTELVPHFFKSLAQSLGANLHIKVEGENTHHMVEACFKACARALKQAVAFDGSEGLPTTKGALAAEAA